jgi:very-short-patch-repair endonuclease
LLLPVRLEKRKVHGKQIALVAATAGSVEANLSLQKYLQRNFGRSLPDFEPEDEESAGSIENYLAKVPLTIDGLNRWRVRRWLVLGHFAFGRLAMYADLEPDKWQHHPAGRKLVQAVLTGTEGGDAIALPSIPQDYAIDDQEIEKLAPFLVHDADASQHSALIDVIKGKDLVVQGPPGTGKSQTIANIIANALALRKRVLFLSEKQAALEVVKRRLDRAGIGEFCLEIHSDKSSSKQVIASIHKRFDIGFHNVAPSTPPDPTWLRSRKEISEYLTALHTHENDTRTPVQLIWQSIRHQSLHAEFLDFFSNVELPSALLNAPDSLPSILGEVEIYAGVAANFMAVYGHPALSPWASLSLDSVPVYEISDLITALQELKISSEKLLSIAKSNADICSTSLDDLRRVASASSNIEVCSDPDLLPPIIEMDLNEIERALVIKKEILNLSSRLQSRAEVANCGIDVLLRSTAIKEVSPNFIELTPSRLFAMASTTAAELRPVVPLLEDLAPALRTLGFDDTFDVTGLDSVAIAILVACNLRREHRPWLGRFPDSHLKPLELARQRWKDLVEQETEWRSRVDNVAPWPSSTAILRAADTIAKSGIKKLISKVGGSQRSASELVDRLGFTDEIPAAEELRTLGLHVQALEEFLVNQQMPELLGSVWAGLSTPFDGILVGLKVQAFLAEKLSNLPGGSVVSLALLRLDPEGLGGLALHERTATDLRKLSTRCRNRITNGPLRNVLSTLKDQLGHAERVLEIDPDRTLSSIELPLREIALITECRIRKAELERLLGKSPLSVAANTLGADNHKIEKIQKVITWIKHVRSACLPPLTLSRVLSAAPDNACKQLREVGVELKECFALYDEVLGRLQKYFSPDKIICDDLAPLIDKLDKLINHSEQLSEYIGLHQQRKKIEQSGLKGFLDKCDSVILEPRRMPSLLSGLLARARADHARRKHPALRVAAGTLLETHRKTFAERDRRKIEEDRKALRANLLPATPPAGNSAGPKKTWTEMALIRSEVQKQQRFVPLRTLLGRAHQSLQAMMPCFMMSPLSLAKFVPAGTLEFDIAVIDEASQMRPEDALGGLLRTKQIVVVGDPKQLPPTDFFNRADGHEGVEDDEEYEDVDDESILEACQKAFRQVRRLKWHYRSRCESLIAFSNREFYDNKLITFPTARPGSFSIDLVRVNGTYQSRQNVAEALQVAENAISFMRRHAGDNEDVLPTLGIVAVNIEQRDVIREELHRLSAGDEAVEEFQTKAEKKGEPVFVKNLENVQGDERDVIVISMTYGLEPGATALKQRFGPINGKQGHRRLNVLFSRARHRIGLFTSFGSIDVKPSEKSHQGVLVLQRYLEYAEGLGRSPVEGLGVDVDSDFELEVADRLRSRGYTVDYQIGVSGYKIDLGVRHPDKPETFMAGIECDGAAYHSSKSARDRDRLREQVLRSLGWTILRVWSTDWFQNPEAETRKLVLKLEKLKTELPPSADASDYRFRGVAEHKATSGPEPIIAAKSEAINDHWAMREEAVENGTRISGIRIWPPHQREPFTSAEALRMLRDLRENVVSREFKDWMPERSILREGMLETFLANRMTDPDDWFSKVPQYLRQNTDAREKRMYLDQICEIVARVNPF